jgi:uncharacterized membrane protein
MVNRVSKKLGDLAMKAKLILAAVSIMLAMVVSCLKTEDLESCNKKCSEKHEECFAVNVKGQQNSAMREGFTFSCNAAKTSCYNQCKYNEDKKGK